MSGIFLFHRDFRVVDNTSLIELSTLCKDIIPIFIFNPDQVDPSQNPYYNEKSIQFMVDALRGIPHLQVFYGYTEKVLESLFSKNKDITYIGFNLDYTEYAKKRTEMVKKVAALYNVKVVAQEDYTLVKMGEIRDGSFYKVFKPFYERVKKMKIAIPYKTEIALSSHKLSVNSAFRFSLPKMKTDKLIRKEALSILKDAAEFKDYSKTRSLPSIETTHLSKYIKFGVVSIREVYNVFRKNIDLGRQIIWHDFYACLMNYLPYKDTLGGGNFQHKKVNWRKAPSDFKKWCDGTTGIPLVDAGMRQLNETGWMHNRVRLIVSNFLAMVLKIDWRKGEKYFAKNLVDYDVASNNLNWQFSAQVGTDRNPFVRIYNPFLQSEKCDPDCEYIKKWVPELKNVPNKDIHKWYKTFDEYKDIKYPEPIIEYDKKSGSRHRSK